jgi:Na+(H+)/acetate symporter ActP
MLGFIFLYFIGKYFYNLAIKHQKNKWLWAILGVLSYYTGTLVFSFILGIFWHLAYESDLIATSIDDVPEMALNLIGIPLGLAATWIFYTLLRNNWEQNNFSEGDKGFLDA